MSGGASAEAVLALLGGAALRLGRRRHEPGVDLGELRL
jgi:MYXO-CTERM domain-containing protein